MRATALLSLALLACGSAPTGQVASVAPQTVRSQQPSRTDSASRAYDPPNPERIVMLAPSQGTDRRLSNINVHPHRPVVPSLYMRPGYVYWGLYKVCVDYQGAVYRVHTIKTATSELDYLWSNTVRTWRYTPYAVNGQPTAFCHPVRIEVRVDQK